jgi:site-specific DNA-cytosine methylase
LGLPLWVLTSPGLGVPVCKIAHLLIGQKTSFSVSCTYLEESHLLDHFLLYYQNSDSHKLGVYHNGRLRKLTPRECARLQGYPDDYKLHPIDTLAYKQIGNAVTVPVIKSLIIDYFKHNKTAIVLNKLD